MKQTLIAEFQYRFLKKTASGNALLRLREFRVYHKQLHPNPEDPILYLTLDVEWDQLPYEDEGVDPVGCFSKMLDVLKDKNVCAYLFLLGNEMAEHTDLLHRIIEEGHCVGNHTMTHQDLTECRFKETLKEIKECGDLYEQLTGETMPRVLRLPYGKIHYPLAKKLYKAGYTVMHWSLHVTDYKKEQPDWEDYESYFHQRLHNGGVILQHSYAPATAENLGKLIDYCRTQGYRFAQKRDFDAFLQQK